MRTLTIVGLCFILAFPCWGTAIAEQQFHIHRESIAVGLQATDPNSDEIEVATVLAHGAFDDGLVLAVLSTAEHGDQEHPLFVVAKKLQGGESLICARDVRIVGLFPTWSASLRKVNGSRYLALLLGRGGDGYEIWTAAAAFTVGPACELKELLKEEMTSYCDEGDETRCDGGTITGRIRQDGAVELETSAIDPGTHARTKRVITVPLEHLK